MKDNRTDNELNRIIAEWCGWSFAAEHDVGFPTPAGIVFPEMWYNPDGGSKSSPPNYCRDLNAVHAAWMKLDNEDKHRFQDALQRVMLNSDLASYWIVGAEARQRAEALVKVIEEGKK